MSRSLSKSLNIKINGYPIVLGKEYEQEELVLHHINKCGFFHISERKK
jgi:hypothetical protein